MDELISSSIGETFDWHLDRPTLMFSYHPQNRDVKFPESRPIKQIFKRISKRGRLRLKQLLSVYQDDHPSKATLIYNLDTERKAIIHVELTSSSPQSVCGRLKIQSIIPRQVDSEWILMSFLKDQRKGVVVADVDLNILCVNQQLLNLFDVREEDIVGRDLSALSSSSSTQVALRTLKDENRGLDSWGGVIEFEKRNGDRVTHEIDVKKLYWCTENVVYLIRVSEVTGLQLDLNEGTNTHWKSSLDLPDRKALAEAINGMSCKDQVLLITCIKPDFHKSVKEEANRRLALALKQLSLPLVMAKVDEGVYCIVSKLCPQNFKDSHAITKLLRKLRKELKNHVHDLIYRDIINGLWGIDILGIDGSTSEQVIERTIQTMQLHDRRKGPYAFFNPQLIEDATREQKQVSIVLEAIRLRNIDVAFQPIIDLKSGEIHRFEALCRFGDVAKLFSVQNLIDTAEKLGVVHVLDKIVAEKALRGFAKIQSKFAGNQNISLNCSLVDADEKLKVFDELCSVIQKFKPEQSSVTVEITESAYFDNSLMDSKEVVKARKNGIDIAVDDFGSGNSSFQYFNNLKFDCIKIDKSFISNIDSVRHKFLAVKMLTELAHELDVKVVVEGVETLSELKTVQSLDVDYVQGYFFSRPRPLDDILQCENLNDLIQNRSSNRGVIVTS